MKKALIVGINDYAPIGYGGPDLNGCVNDARDMANTLVICGFSPAKIKILTNQNATRANILNYLKSMISTSVKGDSLVFYYSGHGTRVANIGSDLELDGLDEAICPHDYANNGVIRDDDFKTVLSKLKAGVNMEVIFDCCYSGTGTRKMDLGLEADLLNETARYIPPMLEDEFYLTYASEMETSKSSKKSTVLTKALVPVAGMNHTLWAAAKDNQVSMEGNISGQIRGYFTYHFCKILRATNGNIVRKTLDKQVAIALAAMGAAQINQTESITAEFSQKIFT
ncbi:MULTISPECIES: caspase family protein [Chryseobacterium]|uniref:caspase family protein n=1 Tax=Chryseobacterium TaxID=59732 RepID=UPI0024096CD3|nr:MULTISPECIES: caspase family protein [Chryseobacterium]MDH5034819.1 caspase family protein [Chryseobacterium cucumeris]WFB66141.1 caspase family protein [Chryseobacterium sp. WX]